MESCSPTSRTPDVPLDEITAAGVTTVVSLLGATTVKDKGWLP